MGVLRMLLVALLAAVPLYAGTPADGGRHDVAKLEAAQKKYLKTLDVEGFAKDYPKVIRDLDATDPKVRQRALSVVGATVDLRALPLVIPLLKDNDKSVRVYAAIALNNLTVQTALERRDQSRPHLIALKPVGPGDLDMRALAAVVLEMLGSEDDNIVAHAATMAGYLDLQELEPELADLVETRKHAVQTQAEHGLALLRRSRLDAKRGEQGK